MKAAFLTSSLIAPKGKASPASPATAPTKLLDDETHRHSNGVSRIYDRVQKYADPHADAPASDDAQDTSIENSALSSSQEESISSTQAEDMDDAESSSYQLTEVKENKTENNFVVSGAISRALSRPVSFEQPSESRLEEIASEVSKLKKDKLGRIRISVRMAPKDHLQLKLIAAHTQMSAQAIFETALEEYVANHGRDILPESCSCILDKTTL